MKYQKDLNRAYAQKKNFKKVMKDLSKSPKKEFDQMKENNSMPEGPRSQNTGSRGIRKVFG